MSEPKTKLTGASVETFLNSIPDLQLRQDCWTLVELMQQVTKAPPQIWGSGLVGFGSYRYHSASGRQGDWMLVAFAPRKNKITLYLTPGFDGLDELRAQLGKHTAGKSCWHFKRLSEIDLSVLKKLVQASVKHLRQSQVPADQA